MAGLVAVLTRCTKGHNGKRGLKQWNRPEKDRRSDSVRETLTLSADFIQSPSLSPVFTFVSPCNLVLRPSEPHEAQKSHQELPFSQTFTHSQCSRCHLFLLSNCPVTFPHQVKSTRGHTVQYTPRPLSSLLFLLIYSQQGSLCRPLWLLLLYHSPPRPRLSDFSKTHESSHVYCTALTCLTCFLCSTVTTNAFTAVLIAGLTGWRKRKNANVSLSGFVGNTKPCVTYCHWVVRSFEFIYETAFYVPAWTR